jgi:hypothetical protein
MKKFGNYNMKTIPDKYIVGHYINFNPPRGKSFNEDFVHDNLKSAMEDFEHLCSILPSTEVEVRKVTTTVAVAREIVDDDEIFAQK